MGSFWLAADDDKPGSFMDQTSNQRDLVTQSVISIVLGLGAFLAFCILRPRWAGLYAARKKQKNVASKLPELPPTFFGWIPVLYRISEEEVLASAGLDAYVFLAFFKLATRFLAVTFFFALVVIMPVHSHYNIYYDYGGDKNNETSVESNNLPYLHPSSRSSHPILTSSLQTNQSDAAEEPSSDFLWMYVAFVYFFTGIALYLIITETKKIIRIRQNFIANQSSVTDRTIRLSGISEDLRSEEKIKEVIEELGIGKVESVILCRDWKRLDNLMDKRTTTLRKLEEALTVHLRHKRGSRKQPNSESSQTANAPDEDDEARRLINGDPDGQDNSRKSRPMIRLWYGFLKLQNRKVDAIDYYEEKLRKLDDQVISARKKDYKPTSLAFVTLDSTAACQMAVQAIIDPGPMKLLANLAPAPSDVIWKNTYLPRLNRMTRAWSITCILILLTIFWSVILAPLAGLLSLSSINQVSPRLADVLKSHPLSKTLVQSLLPTLIITLLNVAVPYLYWWFSLLQGMTSAGEVEMSLISKNFFFTFFNLFLVFTVFGTAFQAIETADQTGEGFKNGFQDVFDSLQDTTRVAYLLAESLKDLAPFYINLIILQGLGLLPFRMLEFGSVALYPVSKYNARTPRDFAELTQPPTFSYGFYLPQTLLIFIICTVYSVLPSSWLILFFGLLYFAIGNFVYKYQLLYAMDHSQHSTGKAWSIICVRIVIGLIVFQIAMTGVLALQSAFKRAILILPLLAATVWFIAFFQRSYEPLMTFIALRSLHSNELPEDAIPAESRYNIDTNRGRNVDDSEETGLRYINPNLISPLEKIWVEEGCKSALNENNGDEGVENV